MSWEEMLKWLKELKSELEEANRWDCQGAWYCDPVQIEALKKAISVFEGIDCNIETMLKQFRSAEYFNKIPDVKEE